MYKRYLIFFISGLLFISACEKQAEIPVYLRIDDFKIETDFQTEGTASSKITTVWLEVDGNVVGAYELPIVAPVLAQNSSRITVIPGINLNGQLGLRNEYEFYQPHEFTLTAEPGTEVLVQSGNKGFPVTGYRPVTTIIRLEDFEGAGVNFEQSSNSDTVLLVTPDSAEVFSEPGLAEVNKKSGKVIVPKGNSIAEFVSINSYPLPTFGDNVYLELNYKCEIPVTFGIFANEPFQKIQAPVVTILPSETWNKIYINLVSEVSAYPNAIDYNIFFGTLNGDSENRKLIYIDNLKLVYY